MIKLEKTKVVGFEEAIRGMRNPMNSWDRSDSYEPLYSDEYVIGVKDFELMMKLAKGGPVHAKYRRMIVVYVDITAPLYWWKEFDTYKVGTVANSCSTMHKIHDKEFVLDDFSHDRMTADGVAALNVVIDQLNRDRDSYLETKDKDYWDDMIQLLPSSYNQKRTVMMNYEVLHGIYMHRRNHKLKEWHEVCDWIESLPISMVITGSCDGNEK